MTMPDYIFYPIYCCLVLMMLILAYFVLFVPRKRVNLRAMYSRTNVIRKQRKAKPKKVKRIIVIEHKGEWENETNKNS